MPLSPKQFSALALVEQGLRNYEKRVEAGITAVCQRYSQEGAGWAKQNAPWKDHTSNARNGLHGYVPPKSETGGLTARISHGVFYGIFLERNYQGRFSILGKVLRRFQAPFLEDVQRVVGAPARARRP